MKSVCRIQITIEAPRERAFDFIAQLDLPQVFRGFGPLPAILGIEHQNGDWNVVGQVRNPLFSDGSTAMEKLTSCDSPQRFGYTVSDFSGPLRFLVTRAECGWRFDSKTGGATRGATRVKWEYVFFARSVIAVPALWVVVALWRLYMKQVLQEVKILVETGS